MELNGIANIKAILYVAVADSHIDSDVAAKIEQQLVILTEYMKVYKANTEVIKPIPYWHEVKAKLGLENV